MSHPTQGSGPDDQQGGAPQGQPGWGPPPGQGSGEPAQGYGQPAPGYGQPAQGWSPPGGYQNAPAGYGQAPGGQRPGQVTAAAVIGIVWGALGALLGLLGLLGASVIGDELGVEITGLDILLGIVGIAIAIALVVGGAQVLQGKAPKLLLYAAYAQAALWLVGVVVTLAQGYDFNGAGVLSLIVAVLIVVLLRSGQAREYFAARGHSV